MASLKDVVKLLLAGAALQSWLDAEHKSVFVKRCAIDPVLKAQSDIEMVYQLLEAAWSPERSVFPTAGGGRASFCETGSGTSFIYRERTATGCPAIDFQVFDINPDGPDLGITARFTCHYLPEGK